MSAWERMEGVWPRRGEIPSLFYVSAFSLRTSRRKSVGREKRWQMAVVSKMPASCSISLASAAMLSMATLTWGRGEKGVRARRHSRGASAACVHNAL